MVNKQRLLVVTFLVISMHIVVAMTLSKVRVDYKHHLKKIHMSQPPHRIIIELQKLKNPTEKSTKQPLVNIISDWTMTNPNEQLSFITSSNHGSQPKKHIENQLRKQRQEHDNYADITNNNPDISLAHLHQLYADINNNKRLLSTENKNSEQTVNKKVDNPTVIKNRLIQKTVAKEIKNQESNNKESNNKKKINDKEEINKEKISVNDLSDKDLSNKDMLNEDTLKKDTLNKNASTKELLTGELLTGDTTNKANNRNNENNSVSESGNKDHKELLSSKGKANAKKSSSNNNFRYFYHQKNRYQALNYDHMTANNSNESVIFDNLLYPPKDLIAQHLLAPLQIRVPKSLQSKNRQKMRKKWKVTVTFYVDKQGKVMTRPAPFIKELSSSGNQQIDDDAKNLILTASFKPFSKDGQAVIAEIELPLIYQ